MGLLLVFHDFLVILQCCFEQKPKNFTVPELDTAFGLRLSSIFLFLRIIFQIQIFFELTYYLCVNIKRSGWTLNLFFFCETAAGKCHNAYKIDAGIWQYFQGDGKAKDTQLTLFEKHADFIVDISYFFLLNHNLSK